MITEEEMEVSYLKVQKVNIQFLCQYLEIFTDFLSVN